MQYFGSLVELGDLLGEGQTGVHRRCEAQTEFEVFDGEAEVERVVVAAAEDLRAVAV